MEDLPTLLRAHQGVGWFLLSLRFLSCVDLPEPEDCEESDVPAGVHRLKALRMRSTHVLPNERVNCSLSPMLPTVHSPP